VRANNTLSMLPFFISYGTTGYIVLPEAMLKGEFQGLISVEAISSILWKNFLSVFCNDIMFGEFPRSLCVVVPDVLLSDRDRILILRFADGVTGRKKFSKLFSSSYVARLSNRAVSFNYKEFHFYLLGKKHRFIYKCDSLLLYSFHV
jgi:hypothetical protein